MPVSLQDGQDRIDPSDSETLRYAVRSDGERGFVSIDNFQDHARVPSRHGEQIDVTTGTGERIRFTGIGSPRGGTCILPFNMDLDGVRLVRANLQPVTVLRVPGRPFRTFVFLKPDGMDELTFHFRRRHPGRSPSARRISNASWSGTRRRSYASHERSPGG